MTLELPKLVCDAMTADAKQDGDDIRLVLEGTADTQSRTETPKRSMIFDVSSCGSIVVTFFPPNMPSLVVADCTLGTGAPSLPSSCETASAVGLLSLRARTDVLSCRSSHQRWMPGRSWMPPVEERREP